MDQSAVDRLFPIPAHQDEIAFYQEALFKFLFVSSVACLQMKIEPLHVRHWTLPLGRVWLRKKGGGGGMGQVK